MPSLRSCIALWCLALGLGGCSVLVDPESLVIKCEATPGLADADPCIEAGMHCVSGTCQTCEGADEKCNGVDDDCDGIIDEGFDQDGDHYTWCGGGVKELVDCAPDDATIHPSTTGASGASGVVIESCDGNDNDCDGRVDESPECNQVESCTATGCLPTQYCDAVQGRCITPRTVGSGCTTDAECKSGFCVDPGIFKLGGDVSAKTCASACCTDTDCGKGTVCQVASNGLRACLPANVAGRGELSDGADCSSAADCSSGVCIRQCVGRCKADGDCDSGNLCVIKSARVSEPPSWMCGDALGHGDARGLCTAFDPTACKSGVCDGTSCAVPCGRDADCLSGERCGYLELMGLLPTTLLGRCTMSSVADTACCTNSDCAAPQLCKPKMMDKLVAMVCQAP